ncbi:MOSC domain-containing protein [Rhizobiaceae bacterium BDR2-2]|uniref:MOSC domain-containing protein n=1 Tax=Ectorhizobium quercum TaxID=2965071 RepID=A0AAE3SXI9_9HYPH|nr:MOSC domain-containing protein [Ectorhizobium quercum]MCX8999084.1 MOSC domain-containing protein [Ectorhizobium quercum]
MRVSDLSIYPLKSGRGIALETSPVDAFGLSGDRRFMLADPSGHFITQRELPELAQVEAAVVGGTLHLGMGAERHAAPLTGFTARKDVAIWKSIVNAALADEATNATLSRWLGRDAVLVHFDKNAYRAASPDWAGDDSPVTFADGYQILVTTTASLDALNANMAAHGEASVGMDRFRPNIVIDGSEAFAEDHWAAIEIGGTRFDLVKPCARCIMTTQDQQTGSREGASPMKAMGRIRMSADRRVPGPLFGWNAVPRGAGSLALGDTVTVLETRADGWAFKRR